MKEIQRDFSVSAINFRFCKQGKRKYTLPPSPKTQTDHHFIAVKRSYIQYKVEKRQYFSVKNLN